MQFGDAIRVIKERLSLADLARRYCNLKPNGSRFLAPCPFHQETKPSFNVFEDKGYYYCFGCQASGDIFDFYARINGLDFKDSVLQLAEEAGITIDTGPAGKSGPARPPSTDRQTMLAMHDAAAAHFRACLARPGGAECREYMARRGLGTQIQERFGLGWAERDWHSLEHFLAGRGFDPGLACDAGLLGRSSSGHPYDRFRGRLMFPIFNLSNRVIAFGGRIIAGEDEAKYINSADTPIYGKKEHLYGLAQARRSISAKGQALLTEGYMDVLTLHQSGFENSVGVLGTALTEDQITRLSGFTANIGLLFDGDPPGRKAALRAASLLMARGMACSVILLPDGEDIDSLLRKAGAGAFESIKREAPDGASYCIQALRQMAPRDAINWAKDFIAKIRLPEMKSHFASLFAQRLGIAENIFREGLAQPEIAPVRNPLSGRDLCDRDTQIMIFLVRYPEKLETLRDLGADLALSTSRARKLWEMIEKHGGENVVHYLDEKQKSFWLSQRGPAAPPRTNCELELTCLKTSLDNFYAHSQAASLQAALSDRTGDFAADLEFLHAIRDTMRKNNEQS